MHTAGNLLCLCAHHVHIPYVVFDHLAAAVIVLTPASGHVRAVYDLHGRYRALLSCRTPASFDYASSEFERTTFCVLVYVYVCMLTCVVDLVYTFSCLPRLRVGFNSEMCFVTKGSAKLAELRCSCLGNRSICGCMGVCFVYFVLTVFKERAIARALITLGNIIAALTPALCAPLLF